MLCCVVLVFVYVRCYCSQLCGVARAARGMCACSGVAVSGSVVRGVEAFFRNTAACRRVLATDSQDASLQVVRETCFFATHALLISTTATDHLYITPPLRRC